ncbi:class I SAM-dependent methyltransferase [Erythrobacter litoralis]|uniref:Methlytransferase, UbiE/COQ5 family protein n=1 Tax=Erythrobacter litoralis (strain HTCC2594) TaxID=314225 RepID=Q2N9K4_ERYLH|nr:class I SAM-dependent methyltransferase [Erythrobacter litoralis]ABC63637.1 methlytransferase, UbiE/COQ5 family protein [Erythrobacter litoralis HTCC2594]
MTDKAAWEGDTGSVWAKHYRRTDRSFSGLTDRLLGAASARRITRALDVGCGAGELSLALARGHPHAQFIGLDVSEALVAVARQRGEHLVNAQFEVGDASRWRDADFHPDLIVSRHGVMFFDDPAAAFAHLRSIVTDDGRLVFSCFRDLQENPWASDVARMVPVDAEPPPSAYTPGPFAFADRQFVHSLLADAGWQDIAFEPVDFAYVVGTGEEAIEDAMTHFSVIGPAAKLASKLDDAAKDEFRSRLRVYLERHADDGLVALKASAWIVTAKKS